MELNDSMELCVEDDEELLGIMNQVAAYDHASVVLPAEKVDPEFVALLEAWDGFLQE
jgi:hypothetical protein